MVRAGGQVRCAPGEFTTGAVTGDAGPPGPIGLIRQEERDRVISGIPPDGYGFALAAA